MKKLLVLLALLICAGSPAFARERIWGYCTQGGKTVSLGGLTSTTKVMKSYPSCTVKVYLSGTTTLANVYSDNSGTILSNPFAADTNGYWYAYVDNGRFDVQFSSGGLATPFTQGDYLASDNAEFSFTENAMAFGASPTFDAAAYSSFRMTLTGNITSSSLVNPKQGREIVFQFCQDAVGGRTMVWPISFDATPRLDTRANKCTNTAWYYAGTRWKMIGQGGDSLSLPAASGIYNGTAFLTLPTITDSLLGAATPATMTFKTMSGGSFAGTIVNGATITGGTYDSATFAGSLTNNGTITGGTLSGTTLAGTTTNSGTLTGGTLSNSALSGTFTGAPTLSGNVIFSGNPRLPPVHTITTANNVTETFTNPAAIRNFTHPDPGGDWNYFLTPTPGAVDCTQSWILCTFTTKVTVEIASCNNGASGAGFDNFSTSAPTPNCVTGSNVIKGVLSYPSGLSPVQQNTGSGAAATTVTTTYPATTVANDLLIAVVGVYGTQTVSGCTDGTNAYTKANNVTNGSAVGAEIWYFLASTSKTAGTTLTCTLSGAQNSTLNWMEYSGAGSPAIFDKSGNGTGSGTAVLVSTSAITTQATELVIPAFAGVGNLTATGQSGAVMHSLKNQSTNGTSGSEGFIIQATTTQSGTFTLGSSAAWAAVIATFKVPSIVPIQGQKTVMLPADFNPASTVSARLAWQSPSGTVANANVAWSVALACTPFGSTDDPVFNAATTVISPTTSTAATVQEVNLTPLTVGSCAGGQLAHFTVQRLIGNGGDTFEGRADITGMEFTLPRTQ